MEDHEASEPGERDELNPEPQDDEDAAPDSERLAAPDSERLAWQISPATRAALDAMMRTWTAKVNYPVPSSMTAAFDSITRGWAAKYASAMQFNYPVRPSMTAAFDAIAQDWSARLAKMLVPLDAFPDPSRLRDAVRDLLPPNWRSHSSGLRLTAVVELAKAGYPVCWVPRAEVIGELAAAADDRPNVLADNREEILHDCEDVLADNVTQGRLDDLVDATREAIAVLRQGQAMSAQALASNVVDTALRHAIPPDGARYYGKVLEQIKQSQDCEMRELRRSATFWPVVDALQPFWPHNGDPIPDSYNRHASAHAVGGIQYTDANALIAVMLATSMLRELQEENTDQGQTT